MEFTPKQLKVLQIEGSGTVGPQEDIWQVYMDGASNYRGAGVGIILISLEGIRLENSFRLGFPASNTEAEYEALLMGLKMSRQVGATWVKLYCDSSLIVSQIIGKFKAKDQRIMSYLREVEKLKCQFKRLEILHISRRNNSHVDSLATLASSVEDPLPRMVTVEILPFSILTPSDKNLMLSIHSSVSWMDPIIAYL